MNYVTQCVCGSKPLAAIFLATMFPRGLRGEWESCYFVDLSSVYILNSIFITLKSYSHTFWRVILTHRTETSKVFFVRSLFNFIPFLSPEINQKFSTSYFLQKFSPYKFFNLISDYFLLAKNSCRRGGSSTIIELKFEWKVALTGLSPKICFLKLPFSANESFLQFMPLSKQFFLPKLSLAMCYMWIKDSRKKRFRQRFWTPIFLEKNVFCPKLWVKSVLHIFDKNVP